MGENGFEIIRKYVYILKIKSTPASPGETFVEATEGALFTTVRYFNRSPRKALFAVSIVDRIESSKSNSLLNLEKLGQ